MGSCHSSRLGALVMHDGTVVSWRVATLEAGISHTSAVAASEKMMILSTDMANASLRSCAASAGLEMPFGILRRRKTRRLQSLLPILLSVVGCGHIAPSAKCQAVSAGFARASCRRTGGRLRS